MWKQGHSKAEAITKQGGSKATKPFIPQLCPACRELG